MYKAPFLLTPVRCCVWTSKTSAACLSSTCSDLSTVCHVNSVWTALYPLQNPCNVFSISYYEKTNPSTGFFHLSTIVIIIMDMIIIIIMVVITIITVVVIIIIMMIMITAIYTLIVFLISYNLTVLGRVPSTGLPTLPGDITMHWTSDKSRYRRTDEHWPIRYHYSR